MRGDARRTVYAAGLTTTAESSTAGIGARSSLLEKRDAVVDGFADGTQGLALALELGRRVAVDVCLGAHFRRVPQRARLVDALQPRDPCEELAHQHDDELRAALALGHGALQVLHARAAQVSARQCPAITDALDVPL